MKDVADFIRRVLPKIDWLIYSIRLLALMTKIKREDIFLTILDRKATRRYFLLKMSEISIIDPKTKHTATVKEKPKRKICFSEFERKILGNF